MDWDKALNKEWQALRELGTYTFVLGVIQNESPNRKDKKNDSEVTNAELLFLHEFGSPIRKIPKRPILDLTINRSQQLINQCIDRCVDLVMDDGTFEEVLKELEITAMRIETIARKAIYDGTTGFKPLSIKTTRAKGSTLPLLDTGQLARSIVCRVIKK